MAGYTRNDTTNQIADGNVINAAPLDGEFNAIEAAFNVSSGHTHDGSTTGDGGPISKLGPGQETTQSGSTLATTTDITVATDKFIQFRDSGLKILSSADGKLDIDADTELEVVAPTVDIDASTAVTIDTTTLTITGAANVTGDLDVDNINLNGNTIISTNTDGNIALTPNGAGEVDISKVDIDSGAIDAITLGTNSPVTEAQVDNININGNSITSTDTNGNIGIVPNGTGKVNLDGDGSSGGVSVSDGLVDIRTGTGSRSQVKFYCESSNAHAQTVQPQPHSAGVTNTLTLPAGSDQEIVGASATQTLTNKTLTSAVLNSTISGTSIKDEDDMSSDSASHLATQQSIKAYVDAQITAEDLDFQADSGGALAIDLDSETLTFTGGTGIDTSGSGNAVTFAIDSTVSTLTGSQTLTNKSLTAPVLTGSSSAAGSILFKEDTDNGTNAVTLIGPAATADVTVTLPAAATTLAGLAVAQEYTASQNFDEQTLTDGSTIDLNLQTQQVSKVTLGGNRTFNAPSNHAAGLVCVLTIIQDGTGSRTATFNSAYKFTGGTAPTLTTTASARDILVFMSDGTNLREIGRSLNVS